jgi:hypothetical protein
MKQLCRNDGPPRPNPEIPRDCCRAFEMEPRPRCSRRQLTLARTVSEGAYPAKAVRPLARTKPESPLDSELLSSRLHHLSRIRIGDPRRLIGLVFWVPVAPLPDKAAAGEGLYGKRTVNPAPGSWLELRWRRRFGARKPGAGSR